MKRSICLFVSILMIVLLFTGCTDSNQIKEDGKLDIVCTIFPEYDWVKEILGAQEENVNLTLMVKNGVDLHSYQPTAQDLVSIATCDLLIYVGGESDQWVKEALEQYENPNREVICLLDILGENVKEEEITEGMQTEEEHAYGETDEGAQAHDEETEQKMEVEYDEHVWLSLRNAQTICKEIKNVLSQLDEANAAVYEMNQKAYCDKLEMLDKEYVAMIQNAQRDTILFGDRFPFRYLTEDYQLNYYAAFIGCSAETEADFETIVFLANKVDELNLPVVLVIDADKTSVAQTIVDNTASKDAQILVLDSLQSVTEADIEEGSTYLCVMTQNLEILRSALN